MGLRAGRSRSRPSSKRPFCHPPPPAPGRVLVAGGAVDGGAVEVQPPSPLLVSGLTNGTAAVFTPNAAGAYATTPAATVSPFGTLGANVRVAAADVNGDGSD